MVITNISGGGLRASLFTFRTMQALDSVVHGSLMDHTRLISGSSGGVIGASYYRGLYMERKADLLNLKGSASDKFLDNIAMDLLNTTAFSFTVSDIFLNMQSFKENGTTYYKDRGYAFEQQLNENLEQVLDKRLEYYREPELNAEIPMMIVSPTIINDGRAMMISPIGISYMLQQHSPPGSTLEPLPDAIEYTRFFADNNPLNTRYTSILRMNATFPYIMPATSLPTDPAIEVMDAGLRDNYGILNSVRFLFEFKDWISKNTSGVVFIQIRDTNKKSRTQSSSTSTILSKITSPIRNVSGNFILMQDYVQDDMLKYMEAWSNCPFDYVQFQLPAMEDKIALSWHLTEKEKKFLREAINTKENKESLERIGQLLNYEVPAKAIAHRNQ
ncbi:MAG TPA: patatin-like phospholipase family protein, partial [Bacteroidia bacterium]|nr:patatin-like phospholipase family protein [Bacteroidia bacterium]